jgi:hypothetical protein
VELLLSHDTAYVCINYAQTHTSAVPPVPAVTAVTAAKAVIRLHGHSHSPSWPQGNEEERHCYAYPHPDLSAWLSEACSSPNLPRGCTSS